jgi:hypothetical protein
MTCFDQCLEVEDILFRALSAESFLVKEYNNKTSVPIRDFSFYGETFRRGHLSVVDARETKNLYLLHCTIMPYPTDPSPIYGFDIISGPKKVSGAFHDFSPTGPSMMNAMFKDMTTDLEWNKRRPLPEWAQSIFSENIVAIGAVGPEELGKFIELGLHTLNCYLKYVGEESNESYYDRHNLYCSQQRKNDRTPKSLEALGMSEAQARDFVDNNLFKL